MRVGGGGGGGHCVYYIARCAWRSDWLRLESECLKGRRGNVW